MRQPRGRSPPDTSGSDPSVIRSPRIVLPLVRSSRAAKRSSFVIGCWIYDERRAAKLFHDNKIIAFLLVPSSQRSRCSPPPLLSFPNAELWIFSRRSFPFISRFITGFLGFLVPPWTSGVVELSDVLCNRVKKCLSGCILPLGEELWSQNTLGWAKLSVPPLPDQWVGFWNATSQRAKNRPMLPMAAGLSFRWHTITIPTT